MKIQWRPASPNTRVVRLAARTALGVLIILFPVITTAAPWYEHYSLAEEALASGNWNEAVVQLNESIQRRADSGAHVRSYGMKVISYFPYLKLGIAYHNLGQDEAAIQALETEEKLGAILESPEDLTLLRETRDLAKTAVASQLENELKERNRIATEGLERARDLENTGKIDEALREVTRVLAVMPDNKEATNRLERLREQSARIAEERDEMVRLESLVADGRDALKSGDHERAASLLGQAKKGYELSPRLEPPADLDEIISHARQRLMADIDKMPTTPISKILEEARQLEASGRFESALGKIQRALAIEPENEDALEMQKTIIDRRDVIAAADRLQSLTDEMKASFAADRFEEALAAANRILAIDSGNELALEHIKRSYVELGKSLLGKGSKGNLPPAVRFADFRITQPDGSRAEIVRNSAFRLSGMTIDSDETELRFTDTTRETVHATTTGQRVGEYYINEFSLTLDLNPGPTTIKVTAVDPEGLEASSEYLVIYRPLLVETTGFRIFVAIAVAGLIILLVATRRSRRRKLRQRRFNPYIAGAPVLSDDLFFGREPLVQRILQTIHNNSLLLHGERRIGKTSLQHHLRRRLLAIEDSAYQFYPVFIDLQGVPEDRFFGTLREDIVEQLQDVLGDAGSFERDSFEKEYGYREFVADLRAIIAALRDQSSKTVKLVLLIDEVDELNDYDPRVNQRLRSLFMKSFAENLVAIVSGVQIKKNWEREASPWYNFFEEIEVTPLGRNDVDALVRRPIDGVLGIEDGLVDRIVAVTGGKPYLVQRLCIAMVNRVYEEGRRVITLADLDAVGSPEVS